MIISQKAVEEIMQNEKLWENFVNAAKKLDDMGIDPVEQARTPEAKEYNKLANSIAGEAISKFPELKKIGMGDFFKICGRKIFSGDV